jgi:hypothetical protein
VAVNFANKLTHRENLTGKKIRARLGACPENPAEPERIGITVVTKNLFFY